MKKLSARGADEAFTLIEVLVILAILAVLAALVIPTIDRPGRPHQNLCLNNLRQIDLGYVMFMTDHREKYPWQLPVEQGGLSEQSLASHFQVLSNYNLRTENFYCPADHNRKSAANYAILSNTNISYFLNIDAAITNQPSTTVLLGDRNLQANGKPVTTGLFPLTRSLTVSWTAEIHPKGGNMAFVDGHVDFVSVEQLKTVIQRQPLATNRLLIP